MEGLRLNLGDFKREAVKALRTGEFALGVLALTAVKQAMPEQVLAEFERCVEASDFVRLADLVEYEWAGIAGTAEPALVPE